MRARSLIRALKTRRASDASRGADAPDAVRILIFGRNSGTCSYISLSAHDAPLLTAAINLLGARWRAVEAAPTSRPSRPR
jgi:hypothetical protein